MKKVYYAHPLTIYNTPQETRDLVALAEAGFEVLNPNTPEHAEGYKRGGMDYFTKLIETVDGVVFRSFPDGSIPAGVGKEVIAGQELGKFVLELPSNGMRRLLTKEQTLLVLRESGQR